MYSYIFTLILPQFSVEIARRGQRIYVDISRISVVLLVSNLNTIKSVCVDFFKKMTNKTPSLGQKGKETFDYIVGY